MQSTHRWSTSLSQPTRRLAQKIRKSPFPQPHRYSSSIPQSPTEHEDIHNSQVQRKKSKRWDVEDHLASSTPTEPRVKPRIVKPDDHNLVDTHSLLNTLIQHQEANARRIRIQALPGPGIGNRKIETKIDTIAKHVPLASHQRPRDEDYEGKVPPLAFDWDIIGDIPRYLRLPWMRELDQQKPSREPAIKRLTTEIQALNRFFSPTTEEMKSAQAAFDDVRNTLLERCSDIQRVDLIGSRASGLATVLSDLDLNLVPGPLSPSDTTDQQPDEQLLAHVWKRLRFNVPIENPVKVIYYARMARIPIVAGIHAPTGLEFQIQVATSAYGSLELAKALQAEWPTLQALFIVLKQALYMRRLSKGNAGGVTSYPLLNMITVSLKYHQMQTDRFDVATQLLQFLDFWGEIDFYTTGITHRPSKYLWGRLESYEDDNPLTASNAVGLVTQDPIAAVPVKFDVRKKLADIHEGKSNFRMTLHDPANPYNDLGRSAYGIKNVQATFLSLRRKLKEDMVEWDRVIRQNGEAQTQPIALLRSLLEGDYTIHNLNRRRLSPSEQENLERSTA